VIIKKSNFYAGEGREGQYCGRGSSIINLKSFDRRLYEAGKLAFRYHLRDKKLERHTVD
jgi:hypothetical protein